MADEFYKACIPDPVHVLGFKLRPLSLGHIIILHRIDSPFVSGNEFDLSDLASAVLICSLTYKEAIETILDPDLDRFMRRWCDRLTGLDSFWVKARWKKPKLIDFVAEGAQFIEYLNEHSRWPTYGYDPGDFKRFECEQAQVIKISLMRDLSLSESELLDRSWRLCLWDYITLRAMDGHVTMYKEGGELQLAVKEAVAFASALADALKEKGYNVCQN